MRDLQLQFLYFWKKIMEQKENFRKHFYTFRQIAEKADDTFFSL